VNAVCLGLAYALGEWAFVSDVGAIGVPFLKLSATFLAVFAGGVVLALARGTLLRDAFGARIPRHRALAVGLGLAVACVVSWGSIFAAATLAAAFLFAFGAAAAGVVAVTTEARPAPSPRVVGFGVLAWLVAWSVAALTTHLFVRYTALDSDVVSDTSDAVLELLAVGCAATAGTVSGLVGGVLEALGRVRRHPG
jgi:hypothetical protein